MGGGVLEYAVEVLESFAQLAGALRRHQVVEDGLVVLVHQHRHALAVLLMGATDQRGEFAGNVGLTMQRYAEPLAGDEELVADALVQLRAVLHHAIGKT